MNSKTPGARCWECPLVGMTYVPSEIRSGAQVLVVGEAPGNTEAQPPPGVSKAPFIGQSGQLLEAVLEQSGHSREDVSLANVVSCQPRGAHGPPSQAIRCCAGRLANDVAIANPKTLLLCGKVARETVVGEGGSWRGEWREFREYNTLSTWHPAYVLRRPGEATAFINDVERVWSGPPVHIVQNAPKVRVAKDYDDLARMLSECPDNSEVCYDLETNQVRWYNARGWRRNAILMCGITWDEGMGIIADDTLLYDEPRTAALLERFADRNRMGGHNIKFDNRFLRAHIGCSIRAEWDTLLMHYVLDENSPHALKALTKEEFGLHDYEAGLVQKYLKSRNDEYSKVPFDQMAQYCAWDVASNLALKKRLEPRLHKDDQFEFPYSRILMEAQEMFTQTELKGVKVDVPYLEEVRELFEGEMERVRLEAGTMVGRPDINLNSTQQVARVLWDDLGLPQRRSWRVKARSTAKDAVVHLKGKHPFVDALVRYRTVAKLKSSYIDNVIEAAAIGTDRVHWDTKLYGTEMGRISIVDPALQTVPRPMPRDDPKYDPFLDGAVIRGAFIAEDGCLVVVTDFSQAELRVLGAESGEPFLIQVYEDERDLHTEVTIAMYGVAFTKEERVKCKMFNFSYVYGGTEFSFADDAGLPIAVAKEFVRKYDKTMPVARAYKDAQLKLMRTQGYVESRFHRRRRFPLITNANLDEARKASVHAPIAGTASDLTLLSMIEMWKSGMPVLFPVHDSVLQEIPTEIAESMGVRSARLMEGIAAHYVPEVKWKADSDIGPRWTRPPELSKIAAGFI